MKKISIIAIAVVAGLLTAVSCSKNTPPVFDDANAFAAFSASRYSIDEAKVNADGTFTEYGDTVEIPVTLASVKGLEGSVKFTVTPNETTLPSGDKYTPVEGTNYKVLTEGGTLRFDAQNRVQYIKIVGKYYPYYTGDLSVTVKLEAIGDVKLGAFSSCTVVLADVDHPLAAILGKYSCTSTTGTSGQNPFLMTVSKDDSDDHKVWIDNIFGNSGWGGSVRSVYGIVDDDMTAITVPIGQKVEYKYSGHDVMLYGISEDGEDVYDTGNIILEIVKDDSDNVTGLNFLYEDNTPCGTYLYIDELGGASYALATITAEKQ